MGVIGHHQPAESKNHHYDLNVRLWAALVIYCHTCDSAIVEKRVLDLNKLGGTKTCDLD